MKKLFVSITWKGLIETKEARALTLNILEDARSESPIKSLRLSKANININHLRLISQWLDDGAELMFVPFDVYDIALCEQYGYIIEDRTHHFVEYLR